MHMLDLINMQLAESIEDTHICELVCKFNRLCHANRMRFRFGCEFVISRIYAVNVVLECLRDGVGNGIQHKDVTYDLITSVDDSGVGRYYWRIIPEKERLIKIAYEEIEMVRRLIETNMQKYHRIIKCAGEMDIYALDRSCADIDNTVGYIRKIIIKIPSIVENKYRYDMIKENEKRIEEKRKKDQEKQKKGSDNRIFKQIKNANKYQDFRAIKYTKSGNTNTIIVSQDFGGNKYSKNIRVTIQIK